MALLSFPIDSPLAIWHIAYSSCCQQANSVPHSFRLSRNVASLTRFPCTGKMRLSIWSPRTTDIIYGITRERCASIFCPVVILESFLSLSLSLCQSGRSYLNGNLCLCVYSLARFCCICLFRCWNRTSCTEKTKKTPQLLLRLWRLKSLRRCGV